LRKVPFTQETDLENQGAYYAETVEAAFDLAAMRDQQLSERVGRAVVIPPSADPSDLDDLVANVLRLKNSADSTRAALHSRSKPCFTYPPWLDRLRNPPSGVLRLNYCRVMVVAVS
jgi:hypothetical protein